MSDIRMAQTARFVSSICKAQQQDPAAGTQSRPAYVILEDSAPQEGLAVVMRCCSHSQRALQARTATLWQGQEPLSCSQDAHLAEARCAADGEALREVLVLHAALQHLSLHVTRLPILAVQLRRLAVLMHQKYNYMPYGGFQYGLLQRHYGCVAQQAAHVSLGRHEVQQRGSVLEW